MGLSVVTIRKGRARPFWHGNPLVFSGALDSLEGDPAAGELVEVRDDRDRVIGQGFFNPVSSYRIRMVRLECETGLPKDAAGIILHRIIAAKAARTCMGLPSDETNAYRLINSEGDGLSGLTVDVYGETAVAIASALWVDRHRQAVEAAIVKVIGPAARVIHRVSNAVRKEEGLGPAPAVERGEPVAIRELGLRYRVDPAFGQKTGHFLDQRDNRFLVRNLAKGRRVLDAFCFTGGFSLNAAAGGAEVVRAVDSSRTAVVAGRLNAGLNSLKRVGFETADAMEVLGLSTAEWDMVICDPPKLASGRKGREAAVRRYSRLNRSAVTALAPGGLLVTCSCSSAVRRESFLEIVRDSATGAGRRITVTHVTGAAADHVLNLAYPEGEYLKCVIGVVE